MTWLRTLLAALARSLASPPRRQRTGNRAELRRWIEQHMPALDAELGPLSLDQVRVRLNALTGCNVQGGDSIEDGSAVFLAALKEQHGSKELQP